MSERPQLIVIGASWGGLRAIGAVLGGLPADFPVPILVVQHRAEGEREERLSGLLDRSGPLPVREVDDKERLVGGRVYLAPAGYHVLVERGYLALSTEAPMRFSRPSIDVVLQTAAESYGAELVGVVLTGANDDGAAGLQAVRRGGGFAIVQDPDEAEQPAMPRAALRAQPQAVVPVAEIAPLLVELSGASVA